MLDSAVVEDLVRWEPLRALLLVAIQNAKDTETGRTIVTDLA